MDQLLRLQSYIFMFQPLIVEVGVFIVGGGIDCGRGEMAFGWGDCIVAGVICCCSGEVGVWWGGWCQRWGER